MSGLGGHGKAVTLMLASAAVLVLFALAYPRTVPHPLLGRGSCTCFKGGQGSAR
jgi:hypothetical protein